MDRQHANIDGPTAISPKLRVGGAEPAGFPRIYAVAKWAIVVALIFLTVLAIAGWTLILGEFAGSGFRAPDRAGAAVQNIVITPECAWPYEVNDHDAEAVCRMFYNLTPEQRAQVLRTRK